VTPWLAQAVCLFLLVGTSGQPPADVATPAPSPITVTPATLNFGAQPVGTSSQPRTATLANVGNTSVTILDITASGIDFSENDSCQGSLAPGASCTIDVTFKPAITGPRMGTVVITASESAHAIFLVLTGSGQ